MKTITSPTWPSSLGIFAATVSTPMKNLCGLILVTVVAMAGCGSDDASQKQGGEGLRCYKNGTCDTGLTCVSRLCEASHADEGVLSFSWQIEDVGLPIDDVMTCAEAGGATVVLEVQNLTKGTASQSFVFPCAAGTGTTPPLAIGKYAVTTRLLRGDNVEVSALSLPGPGEAPVLVDVGGVTDLGTIIFEIQSFSAQWTIVRSAAPAVPVTCASVGATRVEFTATNPPMMPFVFLFGCAENQGVTQAIPDGDYSLAFRLLNAANATLSEFSTAYTTPVNAPAVLPPIRFTVN